MDQTQSNQPVSNLRCGEKTGYARTNEDGTVTIAFDCNVYSGAVYEVTVSREQYAKLLARQHGDKTLIQDVLPYPQFTPSQRDVFIIGTTPAEWDELFSDEAKPMKDYPGYHLLTP